MLISSRATLFSFSDGSVSVFVTTESLLSITTNDCPWNPPAGDWFNI